MERLVLTVVAGFGLALPQVSDDHSPMSARAGEAPKPPLPPSQDAAPTQEAQAETADSPDLASEIVLRDFLVIPPVQHYARSPLNGDAIEAQVVSGTWQTPKVGDEVARPGGKRKSWAALSAGEDGWIRHEALRGGYAFAHVEVPEATIMVLEARGHSMVYVNGIPRAGDVYDLGWLRLPVQLRKGRNELLFHVAQGRLWARLVPPVSPWMLELRDATLPDLVAGESGPLWASVAVINATHKSLRRGSLVVASPNSSPLRTPLPNVPPLSCRKVKFRLPRPNGDLRTPVWKLELKLVERTGGAQSVHQAAEILIPVRSPGDVHRRTFISKVDGSVQHYVVRPARVRDGTHQSPGLILALHDVGVDANETVAPIVPKSWAHVVAPSGRRPHGFDWEEWSRIDAVEAMEDAQRRLRTDPRRTYVMGSSMGGHGAWHLAVMYPDRFAAVGPSGGWLSFWTYGGMRRFESQSGPQSGLSQMLARGTNATDILKLQRNLGQLGVYILHGARDPRVPVAQGRFMRRNLAAFHPNFAYFETPNDQGSATSRDLNWGPMMAFFRQLQIPKPEDIQSIEFVTANPGLAAKCHWIGIDAQEKPLVPSKVQISVDRDRRHFVGTTENVARLNLSLAPPRQSGQDSHESPALLHVELDGQTLNSIPWPSDRKALWFTRTGDSWNITDPPPASHKGSQRYGTLKSAFDNRATLVYGTDGTEAENAWSRAKARFDAETFWYRGNGSFNVFADHEFRPDADPDANVILYGNADSNSAWPALLSTSPVQMRRGVVHIDTRPESGDDLACLFIRPRPGSQTASVAVVGGTGLVGMRMTDRLRYFVSGIVYPDLIVFGSKTFAEGTDDVRVLGYFGLDWSVESGDFVWRDLAL